MPTAQSTVKYSKFDGNNGNEKSAEDEASDAIDGGHLYDLYKCVIYFLIL